MNYEEYYSEVWSLVPLSVVGDDYRNRNRDLLEAVTYDIYRVESMEGHFDPDKSAVLLRNLFVSIQKIGIR